MIVFMTPPSLGDRYSGCRGVALALIEVEWGPESSETAARFWAARPAISSSSGAADPLASTPLPMSAPKPTQRPTGSGSSSRAPDMA